MLRILLLINILIITTFSTVHAESPPTRQKIIVGVEDNDSYPHYGFGNDGEFHGVAREILDAFALWQKIDIEYKPLPIERLYHALINGEVDFKYPDHPEWGKPVKGAAEITYSLPVVPFIDGVLARPRTQPRQIEEIHQLGTILGFTLPTFWQTRIDSSAIKLIGVRHYDSLLLMALVGERVDGVYANVDVGLYRLQQIKSGKSNIPIPPRLQKEGILVFAPELPYERSHYHLSTQQHHKLMQDFNRFLVEQAAQVEMFKRKYLSHAE
jgi:hypothetical protein